MAVILNGTTGVTTPNLFVQQYPIGPIWWVYSTTAQTTSPYVYDAISIDTANAYNTSNGRYTPTVAGYYVVGGGHYFAADSTLTLRALQILKNGTLLLQGNEVKMPSNLTPTTREATFCAVVYANGTTDYFQFGGPNAGSSSGSAYEYFYGCLIAR